MASQAGRAGPVGLLVLLIIVLALTLGFHWVHISMSPRGHKLCVLAKDQLGFQDTFISNSGQMEFVFQHPILAGELASGRGWCTEF